MQDLKSVTVASLRELARKHLGPGHSKLKKAELVAALVAAVPAVAKLAGLVAPGAKASRTPKAPDAPASRARKTAAAKAPAAKKPPAAKPAAKQKPAAKAPAAKAPAAKSAASKPRPEKAPAEATGAARKPPRARRAAGTKAPVPAPAEPTPPAVATTARAEVVTFPARARTRPEAAGQQASTAEPPAGERPGAASIPETSTPPSAESGAQAAPIPSPAHHEAALSGETEDLSAMEQHEAEPLVEGFFVARVAGEQEARRHHLSHDEPAPGAPAAVANGGEALGALPGGYADDSAIALPRDPHTLFVFWDFAPGTRERALQGLTDARAVLRVFDGEGLAREQDFALESRSFYVHGLDPGRAYRVEFHFVGRDGRSRRIGHSTNRVQLPPAGPSGDTSVRFMRVPTAGVPRLGALEPQPAALPPAATVREYITWRRVPLPGSGGFEDVVEVQRDTELTPSSGAPPAGPTYLEAPARSEGSSEQTSWSPSPSGRGR